MANITTKLRSTLLNRMLPVGTYVDTIKLVTANALAAIGDRVQLLTITRNTRLIQAIMSVDATLGAACTIQLQIDRSGVYTNVTLATTAGGASVVNSTTLGAFDLLEGDVLSLLVGGAGIAAIANIAIDLIEQGA